MDHWQIAGRFNTRFGLTAGVRLLGGAAEPVYQPAGTTSPALIRYTRDYARSVLHELAHWCVASPAQRRLPDYGLTYQPPPRDVPQQQRFYRAEVPVQALEMLLCELCGVDFEFSADNPGADGGAPRQGFEAAVRRRSRALRGSLPKAVGGAVGGVLNALAPGWRVRLAQVPEGG